jgi:hypothetical protein
MTAEVGWARAVRFANNPPFAVRRMGHPDLWRARDGGDYVPPDAGVECGLRGGGRGYILDGEMRANFSRFGFTFRYWRTIAGSAD